MLNKINEEKLNELCDKYGSDKGSLVGSSEVYPHPPHNYTKVYSWIFSQLKDKELIIFECGLGTNNPNIISNMSVSGKPGASLRVWRDFFPNAKIYGADIDKDILFAEPRIVTDYMDQTSSKSVRGFWEVHGIKPNIIIDDGLHEYDAGKCLYENSIDRLLDGGVYIIEDVKPEDLNRYKEYFRDSQYDVLFISLPRPGITLHDNTLVVIFK